MKGDRFNAPITYEARREGLTTVSEATTPNNLERLSIEAVLHPFATGETPEEVTMFEAHTHRTKPVSSGLYVSRRNVIVLSAGLCQKYGLKPRDKITLSYDRDRDRIGIKKYNGGRNAFGTMSFYRTVSAVSFVKKNGIQPGRYVNDQIDLTTGLIVLSRDSEPVE